MIALHNHIIEIPSWGTLTLIEAIWLWSGLLALTFAGLRMSPLLDDYRLAGKTSERDLSVIARGYLRRELIRVAQACTIIAIGVYTALEPSSVPGPARTSVVGLVITAALILLSLLVSLQSYLDWRDREEVKWILEARP